ncbi:MAG TPA: hypothetical protein PKV97_00030 [Thauera aminoaromatica]|nr:hypothetical protein [Thauera aminoaromatica]
MSRNKKDGCGGHHQRLRAGPDIKQAAREGRRAAERQKLAELRAGAEPDAVVMPKTDEVSNPRDWD